MTPLLAQIRRGDRAFERLYRRRVADVYRYAVAVLRDPAQAEEVTQRTFVDAYRAFARGDRPRHVRSWLLGLAHAACRERARADPDDEDHSLGGADRAPTPAEIRRALVHLPFNQRAALVMRELERRSYVEIAEVLALAPADVETLVFEARRALREHFEGVLTCHQAERAISRSLDGRLARSERKPLKRHLSECADCARFARSQRAQRSAWKVLANVPVPTSLRSFFGPGGVMGARSRSPRCRRGPCRSRRRRSVPRRLHAGRERVGSLRDEYVEQAKRRPRLDGLAGRQACREEEGARRGARAQRRFDAAEQGRDRDRGRSPRRRRLGLAEAPLGRRRHRRHDVVASSRKLRELRSARSCEETPGFVGCRLRRARSATRSKPYRVVVGGSPKPVETVDESATGSANFWSDTA